MRRILLSDHLEYHIPMVSKCGNMNVSMRTVFRDISDVIENMMVLAFGVYGLQPQGKPTEADCQK